MTSQSITMPAVGGEIDYPDTDGKPMDGDEARELMFDCIKPLAARFAAEPMVYVSGNLPIYYVEGNPRKVVGPDGLVVFGVPKGRRRNFKVWEEGKGPDWVLEIASEATWKSDLLKAGLYFAIGVREYVLFDPTGLRFEQGPLFAILPDRWGGQEVVPDERGRLRSEVLGLEMAAENGELRFYDPATEEVLPTPGEWAEQAEERARQAEERAEQAEERAEQEADLRQAAEHRAEEAEERYRRLEEELRGLRGTETGR